MDVKIHESRKEVLHDEFQQPYFAAIREKLIDEKKQYIVYPPAKLIFNAFDQTPFDKVKVVLLGQDPYHGPGQAMGLSFSVPVGATLPPSLKNIYKEIKTDIPTADTQNMLSGDLTRWAEQGVLLLNAFLTVRAGQPASHQSLGREKFTDAVIRIISENSDGVVFLLRGNFAKNKKALIDSSKHLVLEAAHPSPFSADNGFFGCKHFSKANDYLIQHQKTPIDW